jgi:hypothetical protein
VAFLQRYIAVCFAIWLFLPHAGQCAAALAEYDIAARMWSVFAGVDLDKVDLRSITSVPSRIPGTQSQPVAARSMEFKDGVIDLYALVPNAPEFSAAVLFTELQSPCDTSLLIGTAADWWMRWAVNGRAIYSTMSDTLANVDGNSGALAFGAHVFALPLKKGKNLIAAEVLAGRGGWKLLCTIDTSKFMREYREAREILKKSGGSSEKVLRNMLRDRLPRISIPSGPILATLQTSHPRIFLHDTDIPLIKKRMAEDARYARLIDSIRARADAMASPASVDTQSRGHGRDMRSCAMTCGLMYLLTGDTKYAAPVVAAALQTAGRDGLLDVGGNNRLRQADDISGMALTYDWLFPLLSDSQKTVIRTAIIQKGLATSIPQGGSWYKFAPHNWNQVCNSGMIIGALAIGDEAPAMAEKVLRDALSSIRWGLAAYYPAGVCPEGLSYWQFGGGHSVLTLAALTSALGTDFGASKAQGFEQSAMWAITMTDPAGFCFNFADCGSGRASSTDSYGWFALAYHQPVYAWYQRSVLDGLLNSRNNRGADAPFAALYYAAAPAARPADLPCDWAGTGGLSDVAAFRSSWDDSLGLFVACKAGRPGVNHGHMDIGSFVLTADGVRWAMDPGSGKYELPGYFDITGGGRWAYFSTNSKGHNTLVINDKLQNPDPTSKFIAYTSTPERSHVVMDLSPTYQGQAQRVLRGIAMLDRARVLVQDEVAAATGPVRWGMITAAAIDTQGAVATLKQNGKTLRAELLAPANARFTIMSTKPPSAQEDQNEGTSMLAVMVDPRDAQRIAVLLTPVGQRWKTGVKPALSALNSWGGTIK